MIDFKNIRKKEWKEHRKTEKENKTQNKIKTISVRKLGSIKRIQSVFLFETPISHKWNKNNNILSRDFDVNLCIFVMKFDNNNFNGTMCDWKYRTNQNIHMHFCIQ